MADFWIDDLDTFFEEFGKTATVGGVDITVIFDAAFAGVEAFGVTVETDSPLMVAKSTDVASVARGASVVIESVTYKVTGIQPDGTGITAVILSRD